MVESIYYVGFDIDPVDNDVEEKIQWEKPCTQQYILVFWKVYLFINVQ